jgi:predicted transcriptional regulator
MPNATENVAFRATPDEIGRLDRAAILRGDRTRSAALRRAIGEYVRRAVEEIDSSDDESPLGAGSVETTTAVGARRSDEA